MHSNAPGIIWFHTFKFDPGLTNVQLLSSRHLLMESGFFSLSTLKPKYFAMKVQGNWCNVACLFKKKCKQKLQNWNNWIKIELENKTFVSIYKIYYPFAESRNIEYKECFDCPSPWKFKLSQNNTHHKLLRSCSSYI